MKSQPADECRAWRGSFPAQSAQPQRFRFVPSDHPIRPRWTGFGAHVQIAATVTFKDAQDDGRRSMTGEGQAPRPIATIGFIGLGVMGEAMCGHLARRSGRTVLAHDLRPDPLQRLAAFNVTAATTAEIAARADLILLSLPDGKAVQAVLAELEPHLRPGQCVVDTSTSPVALTREIGARLAAKDIGFADAPVARTREAAARGELSIMVGASDAVFAHVRQILETMGTDVTHCGPVGTGQVVKILNNMLVFENTRRLAEAIALGRRNGVPPDTLLADHREGLGRQLRAAQPRHEVDGAAGISGARVLHPLRHEGPVLRAGDGGRGRSRGRRRASGHAPAAGRRGRRLWRELSPRGAEADRPAMTRFPGSGHLACRLR